MIRIDKDLLLSYIANSEILRLLTENKIVTWEQIANLNKPVHSPIFGVEDLFESLAVQEYLNRLADNTQIREF